MMHMPSASASHKHRLHCRVFWRAASDGGASLARLAAVSARKKRGATGRAKGKSARNLRMNRNYGAAGAIGRFGDAEGDSRNVRCRVHWRRL